MECGEGMDVADLEMPGHIKERIKRLNGKVPVVLIVCAGRPYAIGEIEPLCDAILYSFYPGPWGGAAIANIIKGNISPTGRLPVSIPRSTGQIPCYYNYKESYQGMKYCNEEKGALYSFGEGLTYGDINYDNIKMEYDGNDNAKVTFEVTNMSEMKTVAIPQLYIHRRGGGVTARVRELKNFLRVNLNPMEHKKVSLSLSNEDFEYFDNNMKPTTKAIGYDIILMDQGKEYFKGVITK